MAKDEGIFKKYGLDVEPIFLRGGQMAIQALASGDPPLMSIGEVVQASLAGHDLVLIGGVEIYYDSTVFSRPDITRLEQLKGKRIGISGYGAATHFAAIILANHLKFDPDKDWRLVPGGPDAERIAAMSAGKIDAGSIQFVDAADSQTDGGGWAGKNSRPQSRGAGQRHGDHARLHQKQPRCRQVGAQRLRRRHSCHFQQQSGHAESV